MNSTDSRNWDEIVDLMRGDIHRLGRDPEHAARFLRRFQGSLDGLTAQFRRSWGINAHEMQSIMTLWEFGRMTMTELGRRIPLSRAAVTTLTDRLEKIDLVRRVPDPTDRRRILLEITERVESEMTRICRNWDARVQAYVEQLDPAVWAQTVDIMVNLRQMARDEADVLRAVRSDSADADGEAGMDGSGPREPVRPTWW